MNGNPFEHLNQTAPVSDTQHIRKSNTIRNDLGMSSPKSKAKTKSLTQSLTSKAPTQELRTPSMVFQVNNDCDTSQPSGDMSKKAPPLATDQNPPSMEIFPKNLPSLVFRTELPALQDRVKRTKQLIYCNSLLLRRWLPSLAESTVEREIDNPAQALQSQVLDKAECQWLAMMEGEPMVRYRLRWLVARMVHEFVNNCNKDSTEIAEIVSLGPVLPKELFRKLLSSFIKEFEDCLVLNVELLQGLVQLVQSASSDYLNSDDLVKILSMFRTRLQGAHRQSSEHPYHLTLAVSHILDVMADHKVKNLDRVLKLEPLSGVLSGLQGSSDPFLIYQACYAFQALRYVPDNDSPLQAIRRHSTDAVDGSVKVSGMVKLDVDSALERLGKLQEAFSSTVEKVTSTYESACSLLESGRGVFDSLKEGFGSGQNQTWYPALRFAYALVQAGQLRDLKQLIYEAPCRRDPLFQCGICQLLGEIAVDPFWATDSRQQAVTFLSSLYVDDTDWCRDESVKTWILAIFTKLGSITDQAVSVAARTVLQDLKDQAALVQRPYPLMAHLPIPGTSPVLAKIQKIPYLEPELYKFRLQRLQEAKQPVLIPPMGKVSLKASDNDVFLLTEKVQEFLNSERQVMLILGDSGSGKSTFNKHLESDLLHSYSNGGPIPLFINLPAIDRPDKELITKHLKTYNFSEVQIQEMKDFRQFVVICDGYDESRLTVNLHTANLFNRPGQWSVKMIISCRTQYLSQDYRGRFVPQGSGHYNRPAFDLFQEVVIAPFSRDQIEDYVDQYVVLQPRTWTTQDYMHKLTTIPNLLDLVSNPFLLTLALETLPGIIEGKRDVATITITRVQLYDTFVNHWIDVNKRRLENNTLSVQDRDILEQLLEAGYKTMALDFVTRLASEIFDKQNGHPIVQYVHLKDENTWRAAFFGLDPKVRLLRESAPLSRTGTQYRFIHRSMLEYFFSRSFFDPSTHSDGNEADFQPETDSSEIRPLDADGLLFRRDLLKEPSVIQFLCERVKQNPGFQAQLLAVIHKSKIAASVTTAATNAITILVRAGVSFNGADLRGIRIPGADLSNGWFDAAQLQGADLRDVNFSRSWLRKVDFSGAQMEAVRFGEKPFLEGTNFAHCCAYSPDGTRMVFGLTFTGVTLFDTSSWTETGEWYTSDSQIDCLAFSPDSRRLVLGDIHGKAEILDMSDMTLLSLIGHVGIITCVVFSPCGTQVASASGHEAVRLWNSETGECLFVMEGHSAIVAYSPSGHQLVTGDGDGTFRFWDPATGEPFATQISTGDRQRCLAWSPDGRHIASSIPGGGVRLWNAENGNPGLIFRGHSAAVTGVAFSPDGQLLASSSEDGTVRLWDASTTNMLSVYSGHYGAVWSVTFSPDGQQMCALDSSFGKSVRIWEVETSSSGLGAQAHINAVNKVAYSSDGQSIVSGSKDGTVRQWDAVTGTPGPNLLEGAGSCEAFSLDFSRIVTVKDKATIQLWNTSTGSTEHNLGSLEGAFGNSFEISPCGRWVSSSRTLFFIGWVVLWDLQSSERGRIIARHGEFDLNSGLCMAFSPDGRQLALGHEGCNIDLFDLQSGRILKSANFGTSATLGISTLAYSPNGKQIAIGGGAAARIYLWDLLSDEPQARLECSDTINGVSRLSYSSCGHWIASAVGNAGVQIWCRQPEEAENWSLVSVYNGFFDSVYSIDWNPRGSLEFVTGCRDSSVRVWRIQVDEEGVKVILVWATGFGQLCVLDSTFKDATGLSPLNQKLLTQRSVLYY